LRKQHDEELRNSYFSPDIIRFIALRRMKWEMHVIRIEEIRNAYKILVGKPEGMKYRRKCGNNKKHQYERNRISFSRRTTLHAVSSCNAVNTRLNTGAQVIAMETVNLSTYFECTAVTCFAFQNRIKNVLLM
jgi:hypothetical protein